MVRAIQPWILAALLVAVSGAAATAQETAAAGRERALKVFLECDWCDEQFLRTEITFVDYVRDRRVADVHVLVTTQPTGGGGTEYTLKFIGAGRFEGVERTLKDVVPQASTEDERRRLVAEVFKRGLVRYVSETSLASRLKITFAAPTMGTRRRIPGRTAGWVFRVTMGGSVSGERSSTGRLRLLPVLAIHAAALHRPAHAARSTSSDPAGA